MADRKADLLTKSWLDLALEDFKTISEAEDKQRRDQLKDYKFSHGEQWDEDDKKLRAGRPMLTNNRVGQYVRQLTNQQRLSRPAIQVLPVDDASDPETADVFQGLIRRIEQLSDAQVAYTRAGDWQARSGVGYWRIVPEYADADGATDNQELKILSVRNRFTVYFDPMSSDPAGADATLAYVVEDLQESAYLAKYPDSEVSTRLQALQSVGDAPLGWFKKGGVRVAEVFRVTTKKERGPTGRMVERKVCTWALINGVEILEGNDAKDGPRDLPIPYIPIVRVLGEESDADGIVDYRGIVREATDPQKLSNYMDSATAEMIALAPKAPFIGYEGQFEGHPEWDTANSQNWSKLEARATVPGVPGPLPLPQRSSVEPPIQAMAIMAQRSDNNLRAVVGYVDVGEQERKPETSGKAILARQRQGEVGNSHYQDNVNRGLIHTGRILVAWMPHIYDTQRVLKILGKDDQQQTVGVYGQTAKASGQQIQPPEGVKKMYDLSVGKYDVTIAAGPSYPTKQLEALDAVGQALRDNPALMPLIGDLYFDNLNVPVGRQIAARLKKMLPPALQDEQGQQNDHAQIPPAFQQQVQQLLAQNEALAKELTARVEQIKMDSVKQGAEVKKAEVLADKELALQVMKNAASIAVAHIAASVKGVAVQAHAAEEAQALGHEADQASMDRAHEAALGVADAGHAQDLMDMGGQQAMEQQDMAAQQSMMATEG